jgi:ATP-dependent RNA helicase DDX54/DBP10
MACRIIATPGRLLHLIVEMNLDFKSVQYVVFDEADRLFELGFATALEEILHRLPTARQTLLFSATLPKSLVDFAKAGLKNPKLVRLDVESKISADLRMAFFTVKQADKDSCLLSLLRDVIKVPLAAEAKGKSIAGGKSETGKGKGTPQVMAPHQTLIFTATKHHVSYLLTFLTTAGYSVSHIYGTLDQTARTLEMDRFRRGASNILVVTDVAARGIDIPILENVVNYDFPMGSRVFVHRVGRTARAGRKGWAWNFVTQTDLPYLLDLQLFLGRPLRTKVKRTTGDSVYVDNLVLGTFSREVIDQEVEYVKSLDERESSLPALREVMRKGQGMYERSKGKASQASYKRAKEMVKEGKWGFSGVMGKEGVVHPALRRHSSAADEEVDEAKEAEEVEVEKKKAALFAAVNSFRPLETVFEMGSRGKTTGALLMKDRRKALAKAIRRAPPTSTPKGEESDEQDERPDVEMADENDIEVCDEWNTEGCLWT